MPDPRRLYRRLIESNLPTRVIAHLSVVALVAVASLAGLSQAQRDAAATATDSSFLSFVSPVRGADNRTEPPAAVSYDIQDLAEEQFMDRAAPAIAPPHSAMPTPVPVDPDATPLPAPGSNVGQTATTTGPTTRSVPAAPATGRLLWPVPGGSISQYYHAGHLALDIAAPYGSQIIAAAGGTVTWAGWRNNGGGYVIQIDHGNGMQTVYNHLSAIWVGAGQYVAAGQGIGAIGQSGMATGPHCHFEVIVNGVIDNPLRYL